MQKRAALVVLALALLIAVAFFLHREPREKKPDRLPRRTPVVEPAPAMGPEAAPAASTIGAPTSFPAPPNAPLALPGKIRGVVRLNGPVPKRKTIRVNSDPKCEAMHGERVLSDEFVVDAYGNMQWAFVYVKSGPIGTPPPAPLTPVFIDQVSCAFTPHMVGIRVGQPLVVLNSDDLLHNVHSLPFVNKESNVGLPKAGMETRRTFDKHEVMILIKCDVHPWMRSWVGVLDHPYFSISNAVGSYEISDLPPGNYEIEAWHEKCERIAVHLGVAPGRETTYDFVLDVKKE